MKYRFILLLFLCAAFAGVVRAERVVPDSAVVVTLNGRVGNSSVNGLYGTVGLRGDYAMPRHFMVRAGVQYSTIERYSAEVRPAYFHDFAFGRLHGEVLLHYNRHYSFNNIAAGVGVGLTMDYFWAHLGYYFRTVVASDNVLTEPYNFYYEIGVNCLPKIASWDLMAYITNSKLNDLERFYQPSLCVDAVWYPTSSWGVMLGVAYMPAGMFNISADYYQSYIQIGARYRW